MFHSKKILQKRLTSDYREPPAIRRSSLFRYSTFGLRYSPVLPPESARLPSAEPAPASRRPILRSPSSFTGEPNEIGEEETSIQLTRKNSKIQTVSLSAGIKYLSAVPIFHALRGLERLLSPDHLYSLLFPLLTWALAHKNDAPQGCPALGQSSPVRTLHPVRIKYILSRILEFFPDRLSHRNGNAGSQPVGCSISNRPDRMDTPSCSSVFISVPIN